MEAKRQLDVLERHLGNKDPSTGNGCAGGPWILGDTYSIADMAIWPWCASLALSLPSKRCHRRIRPWGVGAGARVTTI